MNRFGLFAGITAVIFLAAACGSGSPNATTSPSASQAKLSPHPVLSLTDPRMKEVALELVSSAENSTLDWRRHYGYIQNLHDGRGYTAGIMGFCSGTGDMLEVVRHFAQLEPGNVLARYLPVLGQLDGIYVKDGEKLFTAAANTNVLGPRFVADWKQAAKDPKFQQAQDWERDRVYFSPAVKLAKSDGLHALGQFIYFDAAVNMGSVVYSTFQGVRREAMATAKTPAQGGSEAAYLRAFLQARLGLMRGGNYGPSDRVTKEQAVFLSEGNLNLLPPLHWSTYGDQYSISRLP
jgi:chitosanase